MPCLTISLARETMSRGPYWNLACSVGRGPESRANTSFARWLELSRCRAQGKGRREKWVWEGGHNCLLELELDLKSISRWPHTSLFVVCIELPLGRDIWVKCEASVVGTSNHNEVSCHSNHQFPMLIHNPVVL